MSASSFFDLDYLNITLGAVRIPKLEPDQPPYRFSLVLALHLR
jgi:hypothetical protein